MNLVSKTQVKNQGLLFFGIVAAIVLVGLILHLCGIKLYLN